MTAATSRARGKTAQTATHPAVATSNVENINLAVATSNAAVTNLATTTNHAVITVKENRAMARTRAAINLAACKAVTSPAHATTKKAATDSKAAIKVVVATSHVADSKADMAVRVSKDREEATSHARVHREEATTTHTQNIHRKSALSTKRKITTPQCPCASTNSWQTPEYAHVATPTSTSRLEW